MRPDSRTVPCRRVTGLQVVNQVNDIYLARGEMIATYLEKAKELMGTFPAASIEFIQRCKNANVDALAKLALTKDAELLEKCPWNSWPNPASGDSLK